MMLRSCLVIFCLALPTLRAHPELEAALADLNPEIVRQPNNADLLLRRAASYERHGDLALAEADLRRAVAAAPANLDALLRLAGFFLAHQRDAEARDPLRQLLDAEPNNAEALVWRARLKAGSGKIQPAYADYSRALALIAHPPPELFLERAALPIPPAQALAGLDDGLAQLGPVVALSDRAIALELQSGRVDAAVARIDLLVAASERKELYLKRRGDVLANAGRTTAARAAYTAALAEILRLPDWLRESADCARLAGQLRHLLSSQP